MHKRPSCLRALRSVAAAAAAIILIAGCATSQARPDQSPRATAGPALAPSTMLAADSPMAAASVVQSADFSLKAAQDGYRTEVRNGTLLYCWTDTSIGTRIQSEKCLNEAQLRMMMQRAEQQREDEIRSHAAPGCPPTGCH